jgi:hypothetical protein
MLRVLTILTMLLTVAQAVVPASRQAPDHHADGSQTVTRDSQSNKQQPATAPTRVNPVSAQPDEQSGKNVSNEDTQNPVRISEFPSVSVTRDWIDCLAIFFTGVLVIVGFLGVRYAKRTLNAIEGQLAEIKAAGTQTDQMIGHADMQAKAIERQVSVMEDTAQKQLRAYICLTESSVKITKRGVVEAIMFFKNVGQTPAYNVRLWALPLVDSYPLKDPPGPPPKSLPLPKGIIAPQEKQELTTPLLTLSTSVIDRFSQRDYALFILGEVRYRDVFDKGFVLKYRVLFGGPAGIDAISDNDGNIIGSLSMDTEGNEEHNDPDG